MSMRDELIDDINMFLGTDHQPTRDKQMPIAMLFELRDKLELGTEYESRRDILNQFKQQKIIDTNQSYEGTKTRLGVDELKQLHTYLQSNVPRGIERASNKFKKVAEQ